MKKKEKLVLILSILLVSSCSHNNTKRGIDLTLCSIEYNYGEKNEKYSIRCDHPNFTYSDFDLSDERTSRLVCLPNTDYTRLLIELKKE